MTETRLLLLRHGETTWAHDRRHTGRADVPLSEAGIAQAQALAGRLPLDGVVAVWSSPLSRASDTARLAGLNIDLIDGDLAEWDYGDVEAKTTAEIRTTHPGWDIWTHGVGNGETVYEVGGRADRVIARARQIPGTIVLVAHAHLLRVLAARWLGQPPTMGRHLLLDPAAYCLLGWEREAPAIERWNVSS